METIHLLTNMETDIYTLYGDWVTPWIQFVADIIYYL